METRFTRREIVKHGLALTGLGVMGLPEWQFPALAQNEELVPFTDVPDDFGRQAPGSTIRLLDIRNIDGPYTDKDDFYTVQHFDQPLIDSDSFRLDITGLVDQPQRLSLSELRSMGEIEIDAGYECSGNSPNVIQGLASNGRWTGVALQTLFDRIGVKSEAREAVFFGSDSGQETVDFRGRPYEIDQPFARSLPMTDDAFASGPLLAYALNGEPLTRGQGAPLRLIVPGWYGVTNVKWLSQIHLQENRFLGKWQARWYRTLWAEERGGETIWHETEVSRQRIKSVIARVTRVSNEHEVFGFVLNDGTPLQSVEVSVDNGPWQQATLDRSTSNSFSWKLFRFRWTGASQGEHTIVSRATDVKGNVQPTAEELAIKQTGLEDHAQFPRTVLIG